MQQKRTAPAQELASPEQEGQELDGSESNSSLQAQLALAQDAMPTPPSGLSVSGGVETLDTAAQWPGVLEAQGELARWLSEDDEVQDEDLQAVLADFRDVLGMERAEGRLDADGWHFETSFNPKTSGKGKTPARPAKRDGVRGKRTKRRVRPEPLARAHLQALLAVHGEGLPARQLRRIHMARDLDEDAFLRLVRPPLDPAMHDRIDAMRLRIDEGADPAALVGAGGSEAVPMESPKWRWTLRPTYQADSYKIPFRTEGPEGGFAQGKHYTVRVPHAALEAGTLAGVEILSRYTPADHDNPFGRFNFFARTAVVVEAAHDAAAIAAFAEANPHLTVIRPEDLPDGYALHHRSSLGYAIYLHPDEQRPDSVDFSVLQQDPRGMGVADGTPGRDATGSRVGSVSARDQNYWSGRDRSPSQIDAMGASPNAVAAQLGLGDTGFEWLHLIAHRFGGGGQPQEAGNLVLGTVEANSHMMEIEDAVSTLLRRDDVSGVQFTVTPAHTGGVTWLCTALSYDLKVQRGDGQVVDLGAVSFDPGSRSRPPTSGLAAARFFAKHGGL